MKLRWTGTGAFEPGRATPAEVERLLASLRTLQRTARPADGMEARILARLQQQNSVRSGRETLYRFLWRGWAPTAAVASLICVFTGGYLVAHQTSLATQMQIGGQQAALAPGANASPGRALPVLEVRSLAAPGTAGLALASARRKPVAPMPAGRRRGRAMEAPDMKPR